MMRVLYVSFTAPIFTNVSKTSVTKPLIVNLSNSGRDQSLSSLENLITQVDVHDVLSADI